MTKVAIVGVSGYSGAELARLVLASQRNEAAPLELVAVYSDRARDQPLSSVDPRLGGFAAAAGITVLSQADAASAGKLADIVALATPAEASAELAPKLLDAGARVVDLSGAFRLEDKAEFRRYYGFEHPAPALLEKARYGLVQVPGAAGSAPSASAAALIANPGCYATAAILSLAPLVAAGAIDETRVFIDGKSGVSGAGRKLAENYLFMELGENVSPYRVARHQHTPEIELALSRVAGRPVRVTFVPHLLPIKRGLLTTSFAPMKSGFDADAVSSAIARFYAGSPGLFGRPVVEASAPEQVSIQSVHETERARVGATLDARTDSAVSICAIDNLLKGAASQALENILAMLG
ncbi:MAG: N-acetyl-gamma-glutamyl-phosphate reductase [Polyangiaceae bacterium]